MCFQFHSHSIGSDGVRIVEDSFGEAIQPDTQETVAVRRFTLSNQRGVNIQVNICRPWVPIPSFVCQGCFIGTGVGHLMLTDMSKIIEDT